MAARWRSPARDPDRRARTGDTAPGLRAVTALTAVAVPLLLALTVAALWLPADPRGNRSRSDRADRWDNCHRCRYNGRVVRAASSGRRRQTRLWFVFYTTLLLAIGGFSVAAHQWSIALTTIGLTIVFGLFTLRLWRKR